MLKRFPAFLRWLRRQVRSSELSFLLLAIGVGAAGGLFTVLVGAAARTLQYVLFGLPPELRLSGAPPLAPLTLLVLPLGGLVLIAFNWAVRARRRALVDAVEANALHGGRMSVADSAVIVGQTVLSNGFGASVGLEAAYAQLGGLFGSLGARLMSLRRPDARTLVGAGAGSAIAAAFGAPLAGAFYAFEIVIGAYTPSAIAPVVAASLAGAQVAQRLGVVPYVVSAVPGPAIHTAGYLAYGGLGAACALLGILVMRAVAVVETQTRRVMPGPWRPVLGGLLLVPLAYVSPQALSAGHSALHIDMTEAVPLGFIAMILLVKCAGSIVSLGFGFRGGLFFASLFLGTLVGHLYAGVLGAIAGHSVLNMGNASLVGMAALAVAVVGGPFTMTMLVLEATGNFSLTGAVLAASLVSSTLVRELFGYSFSTWRLHLRGETITSARDVGWIKTLTAGRMMRRGPATIEGTATIAELRRRYPLGSTSRVLVLGPTGRYAGIATPAVAFAEGADETAPVSSICHAADATLLPDQDITQIMARFDEIGTDELAVVDADGEVLGLVTETYVRRRYAEELDKAQRDLFGER
ncbi:chloride channel protein [Novosphingobium sp. KCTC 2891]|uniref:chloride channel protein n=1 Tax=Novosphingobium sp. KCTC 2891 TaxID=2989730 RepID=UPI0022214A12|nr:chloride channel protein [Novosphingobium sp. KCTC 2891]MCW1382271.1 chloride channel protein [Novosphingobium sp. KCTC 2891]